MCNPFFNYWGGGFGGFGNFGSLWGLSSFGMMGSGCCCSRCNTTSAIAAGAGLFTGLSLGYLASRNTAQQTVVYVQPEVQYVQAPIVIQQQASQGQNGLVFDYGKYSSPQNTVQIVQQPVVQQEQLNPYDNNPNAFLTDKSNLENYTNGKDTTFQFTNNADISTKENAKAYTTALEDVGAKRIKDGDSNQDGSLDINEYTALDKSNMEKMTGKTLTDEDVKTLKNSFARIDINGDGKVDQKEMATYYSYIDTINEQKVDGKFTYDEAVQTSEAFGTSDATQQKSISDAMHAAYQRLYGTD